ncbi:hypothetical protein AB0L85_26775 [Streptomyces sp. NPDC052051]|uniref:hypothetical protein n=1 Tax=Streptomyces sp. NPDC052051 TaxID=3154649 RepID=UPI0034448D7A
MVASPTGQDCWHIVPPRPLRVLCLRHTGEGEFWLNTWRTLTALLFEWGLAGPHTRAVGVLYDLPDRPDGGIRYDACLSVDQADVIEGDVWRCLDSVRGLRYEVIMSEAPLARVGSRHSRRLTDMSVTSGTWAKKPRRGSGLGAPLYEVYPCSPIFLEGDVPVVEWYQTVHAAQDGPVRCGSGGSGGLGGSGGSIGSGGSVGELVSRRHRGHDTRSS